MDVSTSGPSAATPTHHLAAQFANVRTEVLDATAEALGISVDRLRAEVAAGKPLADIAALVHASIVSREARVQLVEEPPPGTVDVRL